MTQTMPRPRTERPVPPARRPAPRRQASRRELDAPIRIGIAAAIATALGSLALLPLFEPLSWIAPTWTAIGLVALTAFGARALRVPPPLTVLPPLFVLLCFLCAMYAPTDAILGFLPGPGGLRELTDTLRTGFDDIQQQTSPTPVITSGLSLMTAGGIGVLAILIDLLSVDLRRPALVGLPLLALFSIPAAILKSGVGWLPFAFGAAGFLGLLAADGHDRLARWGRPMRRVGRADGKRGYGEPSAPPDNAAGMPHLGWRAGAVAICIAALVPAMLPGLHSGWFGRHTSGFSGGFGNGDGNGVRINPFVSLKRDLTSKNAIPVYAYTSTSTTPDYMRMVSLDTFDGTVWRASRVDARSLPKASDGLQPDIRVAAGAPVTTRVTVDTLDQLLLPLPLNSIEVSGIGSNWRYDAASNSVLSTSGSTRSSSYEATSEPVTIDPQVLRAVSEDGVQRTMSHYLELPKDLPPEIRATAAKVTEGKTNAFDQALALQDWFTSEFTYSLDIKTGHGDDALMSFLRDRKGYCEQFAATMAVMARSLGIPARIGVGFTRGTRQPNSDVWTVTTLDAHAWPELYFPGVGWLRFEPTPRSDGEATAPAYTLPQNTQPGGPGGPQPTQDPAAQPTGPTPTATDPALAPTGPSASGGDGSSIDLMPMLLGAVALGLAIALLGAMPLVHRALSRRRWNRAADDPAALAHVAWAEVGDRARDLGIEWRGDVDSPRRAVAHMIDSRRLHYNAEAEAALARLGAAEERARYARTTTHDKRLRDDVDVVLAELTRTASRSRRLTAFLVPLSVRQMIAQTAADLRSRLDVRTRLARRLDERDRGNERPAVY